MGGEIYGIFNWIFFVFLFAAITWVGLLKMFVVYGQLGDKEALDFIWQVIGFNFVLAALLFNMKPTMLTSGQRKSLPVLALLFIWAGFFIIVGYGSMMIGSQKQQYWYSTVGNWLFIGAQLLMSLGIATMLVESFRRIFVAIDDDK